VTDNVSEGCDDIEFRVVALLGTRRTIASPYAEGSVRPNPSPVFQVFQMMVEKSFG